MHTHKYTTLSLMCNLYADKPRPARKLGKKTRHLLDLLMFSKSDAKEKKDFVIDDTIDWWSKYFESRGQTPANQVGIRVRQCLYPCY